MDWIDFETFKHTLNTILALDVASQIAIWTTSLGVAAWVHSGRVKKEIALQMSVLVTAINNLGEALRSDLQRQSQRIDFVSNEVGTLTSRVEALETEH